MGTTYIWSDALGDIDRRVPVVCQKRPTTVSKDTYYSVKRDLLLLTGVFLLCTSQFFFPFIHFIFKVAHVLGSLTAVLCLYAGVGW
jgi:hypothetical protein